MRARLFKPTLVAVAIVGALVAGGIAYATIPDSNGVIHACYHVNPQGSVDGSGNLRVIDPSSANKDGSACKKDEKTLDFNQTGPPGQPGQQGAPGPQGPTGPSDVWSVDGYDAGNKNVGIAPSEEVLATTSTLPAGSYFVQAETSLENNTAIAMDYVCDIVDSSANTYGEARATTAVWVTLPVQAVVTLANPDTISFECTATGALSEAFNWQLAAIKIGTVHS
jgi:hypothetical protein